MPFTSDHRTEETWQYMMTKSKDQDIFYYFSGLHDNTDTRHFLVDSFRKDFDAVRVECILLEVVLTV